MPEQHIAFLAMVLVAFGSFAISLAAVAADYTKWRTRNPLLPSTSSHAAANDPGHGHRRAA